MRKFCKRLISATLCAVSLTCFVLPISACKEDRAIDYNSETEVLKIGVDAIEGNFNPFYASADGDLAVVAQTQLPLISIGADGYPSARIDEATVARSFQETTYNALGEETKDPVDAVTTRYEFVIKDEAKFSDGTSITIKDVLFNLYAYLDPAYTAETALRDMRIQGLQEYRLQTTEYADGEAGFTATARSQIADILNALRNGSEIPDTNPVFETVKIVTGAQDGATVLLALENAETLERVTKKLASQAHVAYCKEKITANAGMTIKNIRGIEVNPEGQALRDHNGRALVEPCDLLRITVDGVDPMAIYNFTFPIAPMHYYSNETQIQNAIADTEHKENFGVAFADTEFFETVLGASQKNALPLGAGAYVPTNAKDNDLTDGNGFFSEGRVYLKRNAQFETVGEDIENAKIKHVQYVAVASEERINAIKNGTIDIGAVSPNKETLLTVKNTSGVDCIAQGTQSYAYVGINAEYVPELQVRQAIMRSMNRKSALAYYTNTLATIVNRPVSAQSWGEVLDEEENVVGLYESMEYTRTASEIETLVESAGYRKNEAGIYAKNGKTLTLTFLVPADGEEHFAYAMLKDSATWLNEYCGFDITLICDSNATPTQGGFAVWADEREILPDPDLCSVFHKDEAGGYSNGWGYSKILINEKEVYAKEKVALQRMSTALDQARSILNKKERLELYEEVYGYLEQLCIEMPVCQSHNLTAYSSKKLNVHTFNEDTGYHAGAFDRLWEINFK